jgi:uncharacterized protein (TIRG00374 family)
VKSLQDSRINQIVHTLLAGLAVGLLSLVFWQNRDTIRDVLGRRLDLRLLGLGFLITQVSLLISFFRWFILVRVVEPRLTIRATMLLGFVGYVFNLLIPGAVGGDLVKAAYLSRMQIKKTQAVASMLIDRMLGLLGLSLLAAIAGVLAWQSATPAVRGLIAATWSCLGLGVILFAAVFGDALPRLLPGQLGARRGRPSTIITELKATSTTYRRRLDVVLAGLGLSVISHGLNVLVLFIIGKMLFSTRMTTTLGQHFLMGPLTFFTMAVPLPFGALGFTEEVGGQLFKLVGHPSGAMTIMGLRVLMLACGLEGACVYLANLNEVRALTALARRLDVEPAKYGDGDEVQHDHDQSL